MAMKLKFCVNLVIDNDYKSCETVKELYEMLSDDNQWAVSETFCMNPKWTRESTTIYYNKRRCWRNLDNKELSIRVVLADCCELTTDDSYVDLNIEKECDIYTFVNIYIPSGRLMSNCVKAVTANFDGHEFKLEGTHGCEMYGNIYDETPYVFLSRHAF